MKLKHLLLGLLLGVITTIVVTYSIIILGMIISLGWLQFYFNLCESIFTALTIIPKDAPEVFPKEILSGLSCQFFVLSSLGFAVLLFLSISLVRLKIRTRRLLLAIFGLGWILSMILPSITILFEVPLILIVSYICLLLIVAIMMWTHVLAYRKT